jgi:hypothetical protein
MGAVWPGFDDHNVPASWNGGVDRLINREVIMMVGVGVILFCLKGPTSCLIFLNIFFCASLLLHKGVYWSSHGFDLG